MGACWESWRKARREVERRAAMMCVMVELVRLMRIGWIINVATRMPSEVEVVV